MRKGEYMCLGRTATHTSQPAKQAVSAVLACPLRARAALPKRSPREPPQASKVSPTSEEGSAMRLARRDRIPTTYSVSSHSTVHHHVIEGSL